MNHGAPAAYYCHGKHGAKIMRYKPDPYTLKASDSGRITEEISDMLTIR